LGSLCLFLLFGNSSLVGGVYYVCIVFAFSVKMSVFTVHLLLTHFEAHVSGSMILTGVSLKLGGVWSSSCFCCVVSIWV
jgi:NADH:ubiquinone oxidoreductase subunit 4 (subunit M)